MKRVAPRSCMPLNRLRELDSRLWTLWQKCMCIITSRMGCSMGVDWNGLPQNYLLHPLSWVIWRWLCHRRTLFYYSGLKKRNWCCGKSNWMMRHTMTTTSVKTTSTWSTNAQWFPWSLRTTWKGRPWRLYCLHLKFHRHRIRYRNCLHHQYLSFPPMHNYSLS